MNRFLLAYGRNGASPVALPLARLLLYLRPGRGRPAAHAVALSNASL